LQLDYSVLFIYRTLELPLISVEERESLPQPAKAKNNINNNTDLAVFYGCIGAEVDTTPSLPAQQKQTGSNDFLSINQSNGLPEKNEQAFAEVVQRRISVEEATKVFKKVKMESKKESKGSNDKLVEAFMKSEIKKNLSLNDLVKEYSRVDSGNRRNGGGVSPDNANSDSDISLQKNPKKLRVFEGLLSDDLPPLNSKIVRIFTSSTFTGKISGYFMMFLP